MSWKVTEGTQYLPLACTLIHSYTHACIPNTHEYTQILRKRNYQKKLLQLFSCAHGISPPDRATRRSGQPDGCVLWVGQALPAMELEYLFHGFSFLSEVGVTTIP